MSIPRIRFFVVFLSTFGNYRPGDDVCIEGADFDAAAKAGVIRIKTVETDGQVEDYEGPQPGAPLDDDLAKRQGRAPRVPLATLTDSENAIIEKSAKAKAKDDAKAKAADAKAAEAKAAEALAAEERAKDEAKAAKAAEAKKLKDDAKAKVAETLAADAKAASTDAPPSEDQAKA